MDQFIITDHTEPKLCKFMITNNTQCNNPHRNRNYHLCYIHAGECKRIYPTAQRPKQTECVRECAAVAAPVVPAAVPSIQQTLHKQPYIDRQCVALPVSVKITYTPIVDPDLAEVMTFGKHKGKTYQVIIEKHPDYITKFIVPAIESEDIRSKEHPSGYDKVFLKLERLYLGAKKA